MFKKMLQKFYRYYFYKNKIINSFKIYMNGKNQNYIHVNKTYTYIIYYLHNMIGILGWSLFLNFNFFITHP